ncbi:MAG: sigma-54-dependent Fis family transcriptional regulator [Candidatus Atribacteria bacterium]|nr:sigma-54-dependent Fis family transcriptional regulator [Candidatus Atribacteria bacterium]
MTKINILIIDDEAELCQTLSEMLKEGKEGYKVSIANRGKDGLVKIKEEIFDLVLLDIKMLEMDGIETLEKIKALDKNILVIMLTAYQTVETAVKAMKLGAYDYISKPFNYEELKIIIKRALQTRDLSREVISLRHQLRDKFSFQNIIGRSDKIKEALYKIEKVAPTNATVLIRGESGTGKELIAKTIHQYSPRKDKPFVAVDCAGLTETLIESELFGHTKGAFTGAIAKKIGKFELAQGGTLFLDEIGNLPINIQIKLLRTLQEREINRIGEKYPIKIDARFVVATNANLEEAMKSGVFREDLYHRINVFSIFLPPLREKKEDIPLLALHFLNQFNPILEKNVKNISKESMELLVNYPWPGNVREVQNVIQQAIIMAEDIILPEHLPVYIREANVEKKADKDLAGVDFVSACIEEGERIDLTKGLSLKEMTNRVFKDTEREIILETLKRTNWNKAEAARLLKINYKTLYLKIKEYKLYRP